MIVFFRKDSLIYQNKCMFQNISKSSSSLCVYSVLETKTETLGPSFTSYKISDLLNGRTYIFTIRPLYGEVEGPISTVYQRIGKTLLKLYESLFGS